ncbi:hypothetical protein [Estrella lausannensis]|uniref:Uncharacterized protein n=1 Tax=Estrella lausannensis TaxID=483423 RepID=A0A0H5DPB8_9BACT|nr:hypothetical protein [Estrella lausannensis]CRX37798.1 conserved hypothetical protein [Estrella lausannensis]
MSEATGSVNESSAPASTGATAGATNPTAQGSSNWNMQTTVHSVDQLRQKAPDVYNAMLQGIASSMVGQMKRRQDRLKEIMREARRAAGIR